jgi:hypothetical protein
VGAVFLSFSGDDGDVVRIVHHTLKRAGLSVWDYSDPGEAIPLAASIPEALRERVRGAQDVIVFVSPASLDPIRGRFVHLELACALESGLLTAGRITPIGLDGAGALDWGGPFAAIQHLRRVDV